MNKLAKRVVQQKFKVLVLLKYLGNQLKYLIFRNRLYRTFYE